MKPTSTYIKPRHIRTSAAEETDAREERRRDRRDGKAKKKQPKRDQAEYE